MQNSGGVFYGGIPNFFCGSTRDGVNMRDQRVRGPISDYQNVTLVNVSVTGDNTDITSGQSVTLTDVFAGRVNSGQDAEVVNSTLDSITVQQNLTIERSTVYGDVDVGQKLIMTGCMVTGDVNAKEGTVVSESKIDGNLLYESGKKTEKLVGVKCKSVVITFIKPIKENSGFFSRTVKVGNKAISGSGAGSVVAGNISHCGRVGGYYGDSSETSGAGSVVAGNIFHCGRVGGYYPGSSRSSTSMAASEKKYDWRVMLPSYLSNRSGCEVDAGVFRYKHTGREILYSGDIKGVKIGNKSLPELIRKFGKEQVSPCDMTVVLDETCEIDEIVFLNTRNAKVVHSDGNSFGGTVNYL